MVVIKQLVGNFEQAIVHTILSIEEQIVVSRLNQSLIHRGWAAEFVFKSWAKLILVPNKNYLLCFNSSKKGLVFFDLCGLINDYCLYFQVSNQLSSCASTCCDDYFVIPSDFLFELFLLFLETFELLFTHFLYVIAIKTE